MAKRNSNAGTGTTPLEMAKNLSDIVNQSWNNGDMLEKVTPVTADLLNYWFSETFTSERDKNFHNGQKQAILNTVYCHEIMKATSVSDIYSGIACRSEQYIVSSEDLLQIIKEDTGNPKYCIKMATGTGKTWVLDALLIWQYLNATHTPAIPMHAGIQYLKFTKNFLLIAPGLIVYERLLDAFKGKKTEEGRRDFNTSDFKNNEELFIPDRFRQSVYSFVQNSVAEKDEIGRKTTGDGIIAITNWHLLNYEDESDSEETIGTANISYSDTKQIVKDLLPVSPGITSGNSLDTLDARFLRGGELEFLANMKNLCVFNDEAHHIYRPEKDEEKDASQWKKALNKISENKGADYLQVDFSATPYMVSGNDKNYLAHIVVDFDLTTAMRQGLVKSFVLDKRVEVANLANEEINFRSEQDSRGKVIGLSQGQRIMLRAGLTKLRILEENFPKSPKMLIMCENTTVSPYVVDFLKTEGLNDEDIMRIDSDKKGNIPPKEWDGIKQRLFNIDKYEKPKVIVSVLMLREGFDVSNVCVIVPLRATQAPILLEQTLGRGLRLMWREPEYAEIKEVNRNNLYRLKKAPESMHDLLYVVEHPAFEQFYQDLDQDLFAIDDRDDVSKGNVLGDMIEVGLKENYQDYDMYIPAIIKDKEEMLNDAVLSIEKLLPCDYKLKQLKNMVPKDSDERFVSEEIKVLTRFGEYRVNGEIFNASSYNEYLQRILAAINVNITKTGDRTTRSLPLMQINNIQLIQAIDQYIRTQLFDETFDPLADNNWRVLMFAKVGIVQHIMKELSKVLYNMQNNIDVEEAVIEKRWFSEIKTLKIRENYSLDIQKSIYTKTGYPSNKGGFEKDFLLACDADSEIERLIKINENKHVFTRLRYVRSDGMLSSYFPDFMVKTADAVYLVETKAEKDISNINVQAKQRSAFDWVAKINELHPDHRMNAVWKYVLLDDTTFYTLRGQNASVNEILEKYVLIRNVIEGRLF